MSPWANRRSAIDALRDESSGAAGAAGPVDGLLPRVAPTSAPFRATFTQGPILRHVAVMTATGTVGVLAIFLVDFLSLLYVSRLGQTDLTAAVGLATQVLFFPVSVNIGLTIGVTALMSRALGAGDRARARRLAGSGLLLGVALSAAVAAGVLAFAHPILTGLGATGSVTAIARTFLWITLPANVPFAAGMVLSGALRANGDARRAMVVTLAGGIVTGIADPILIFGLHLGVNGAAISTVLSRLTFAAVGYHGAVRVRDLVGRPRAAALRGDVRPLLGVALPAIGTNLATPVASSYVFHTFARFGDAAIAATAVTSRVALVAFGVLYALSGAVGPILGQNLGAGRLDRVRATLTTSFGLVTAWVLLTWALLWLSTPAIVALFGATGDAARYIAFFCAFGVSAWLFTGFLFVANASFNNLGFPLLSLAFNWGLASGGTIPFVTLGAAWGGVPGGQLGIAFGAALFGLGGLAAAYGVSGRLAKLPARAAS